MKSFYEILEVSERASTAEIRSAYLKLAREYHPDRVPEHLTKLRVDAEDKFKQVQEAWAVLSDPAQRRRYDLTAQRERPQPEPAYRPPPPAQPTRPVPQRRSIQDLLRGKEALAKWVLIVVIMTLAFVVVGELVVTHVPETRPVSTIGDSTQTNPGGGLKKGVRQYNTQLRRIQTWAMGGGPGLDVQLITVTVQPDHLEISFRFRAGAHSDLLLYEPPGAENLTRNILGKEVVVDRDLEEIYIEDNNGTKFYSTTGLIGGRQVNFNLYNFTHRINFRPHEDVTLSAKFPPINGSPSSITFVSPALGKWQPEWRWPAIDLK